MPEEAIDLRNRVTAQMGSLFTYQGLYQEALEMHKWKELEKAFREIDAEFLSKLAQLSYNFKPTEWKVCLLLKAGFTPTQIGTLTGNPIQTISSIRARMAERMLSGCHSAKDWDEFICSL